MKIVQAVILFSLLFFVPQLAESQQPKENEVVVIKGEKYILHQVRTGETLFSISRDFKVDRSVIVKNNPQAESTLNIGDVLKIPFSEGVASVQTDNLHKGDPVRFEYHTIESRNETPYFIAKEYGITVEEIYAYNPEVSKIKKGMRIRIPRWDGNSSTAGENFASAVSSGNSEKNMQEHQVLPGETLFSLARKYNVSESEILKYNPEANNLKAGAKIIIPSGNQNETKVSSEIFENTATNQPTGEGIGTYFEHIIESGETIWGISQKYKVKEADLIALNPLLADGFPAGAVIKIPAKNVKTETVKPLNEDAFQKHVVKRGETLFGLASRYDLTISEIKKYNPSLENRNLLRGETVLIPLKSKAEIAKIPNPVQEPELEKVEPPVQDPVVSPDYYKVELPINRVAIPESCKPNNSFSNETFDVALFLPLFIEANDTLNKRGETHESFQEDLEAENLNGADSNFIENVVKQDKFIGFYKNTENYLQFYEGVLLAIDSMQKEGMNIRLNVFDTQQKADEVRKVIGSRSFLETDLIIGPVFPEVQKEISAVAAKSRIPIISPLSPQSNEINSNPYFYQVNPDRDYLYRKTAEMVAEDYFNSNFIVFKMSNYSTTPEGKLVELIREKLYNSGFMGKANGAQFSIYDFQNDGIFGLRNILSKEKENVIFIPSTVEGELSIGISNINNLAEEFSITLIGTSRYPQYESIQLEYFHNLKLKFISPYWTNYKKLSTIHYIEKFKSNFYTEPNNFGMQGYDVAFYFLNALKNYGKDFRDCLPYLQVDLVQGNYHFEKVSSLGGYINQGVSVISYERNFDVVRKRVEGQMNPAAN